MELRRRPKLRWRRRGPNLQIGVIDGGSERGVLLGAGIDEVDELGGSMRLAIGDRGASGEEAERVGSRVECRFRTETPVEEECGRGEEGGKGEEGEEDRGEEASGGGLAGRRRSGGGKDKGGEVSGEGRPHGRRRGDVGREEVRR